MTRITLPRPSKAWVVAALASSRHRDLLTPREEAVLRYRYGLGGGSKDVSEPLATVAARIEQIEAKALWKLMYPASTEALLMTPQGRRALTKTTARVTFQGHNR